MGVSLVFRGFCAGTGRRARRFQTPHLHRARQRHGERSTRRQDALVTPADERRMSLDVPTFTVLGFLLCIAGAIWPETRYCATSLR